MPYPAALLALLRQSLAGLRLMLLATVVLGLGYPLLVLGVGHLVAPWRADGSLVTASGAHTTDPDTAVGSALLGQSVGGPGLFYGRPSAVGPDPAVSGASNLGPNDPRLVAQIQRRRAQVARREDVDPARVPADAVTASGSGLDPDISPAYAALQVPRVARVTGLGTVQVQALVAACTDGRTLGVLGEPRVNLLCLDLAVQQAVQRAARPAGR